MVDQSPLCTHGVPAAESERDESGDRETDRRDTPRAGADRAAILATVRPTEETFTRMGSTTT